MVLRCSLVIRDSSPSFKVELLRDWVLVLPENVLAVVLVVGDSSGHGYGVILKSVVLKVGGYRVLGAIVGRWWLTRRKIW